MCRARGIQGAGKTITQGEKRIGRLIKYIHQYRGQRAVLAVDIGKDGEARHSAAIRNLLDPGSVSFAGPDVVDKNGLDVVRAPADVLALADPFIVTEVTAMNL